MNSDVQATDPSGDALRRAIAAVRDMRERLAAVEAAAREPVAIVGMAARLPGAADLAGWWQALQEGADAIREVPASRWDIDALYDPDPDAPGRMSTRWGGFIDGVEAFDAGFFGISPREAVGIDPQQRLLLELAWHALEDAGIAPDSLKDSATGVFVGISTNDYAQVLSAAGGAGWIDSHASVGNSVAVAAGRIAYQLGLRGPTMAIDTACSSSLVALHQAVRSLRAGESRLALVGGANLMLRPELSIGFSKARMMAADGRCKTFDAAADGYVRGEGCAVLVLKRLRDALADGDPVHAVVLGSAVNHDGRSNGLTAPNGAAQADVLRAALRDAGIDAAAVGAIEAHGTGTSLGDPIEARALAEVYGERSGAPAWLASVKTQVGHLEAAAGLAGLVKAALAVRDGRLPPQLHFRTLNPHIAQAGFPFRIPTRTQDWDAPGQRIAGVSSFGFSGTNAHVIVAQPPQGAVPAAGRGVHVLPLSARSPAALAARREGLRAALARPGADLATLAATLGAGRAHHAHRLAVCAATPQEALRALDTAQAQRAAHEPGIGLLFTGQGAQYAGMARGLLHEPVVRDTLAECDAVLAPLLGLSLTQALREGQESFGSTALAQPALFAIEVAIARLWAAWGVQPRALLGHSLGELAAACFAGAIDLAPALRFVVARGRLMQSTAGQGGMVAVLASAAQVEPLLAGTGAVLAAANSPRQCTVAGTFAALAQAEQRLAAAGLACQALEVATAFHSAVLDPVLPALAEAAAALPLQRPRMPIASNLTGALVRGFDADHWVAQARQPVRFEAGLQALAAHGCEVFIEVGPQAVLSGFGRTILPQAQFLPSLRRGAQDAHVLAEALARLYTLGATIDWRAQAGPAAPRARLPGYPFERTRHWPDAAPAVALPLPASGERLLGQPIDTPLADRLFASTVSTAALPFLADHVVFGQVVVPGAMHAVLGLQLARAAAEGDGPVAVDDLVFEQPLDLPADGVQLQVAQAGDAFQVQARAPGAAWVRHASGRIVSTDAAPPQPLDLAAARAGLAPDTAGPDALFDMLATRGIELGPSFRGCRALWRGEGRAVAEIARPAGLPAVAPLHPALLDACFQCLGATFTGDGEEGGFLPLSIDRLVAWGAAPERFFCVVTVRAAAGGSREVLVGDFTLCDAAGAVFAQVQGLQIKRVQPPDRLAGALFVTDWTPMAECDPDWAAPAPLAEAVRSAWPLEPTPADAAALAAGLDRLARACAAEAVHSLSLRGRAGVGAPPSAAGPHATADPEREGAGERAAAPTAAGPHPSPPPEGEGAMPPGRERLWRRVQALAEQHDGARSEAIAADLHAAHPQARAEIELVLRCGQGLPGVLRGTVDPLQLLLADGGGIYAADGLADRANRMAAAAVAAAVARRADGRPLRVLEVGAGTGATTERVLEMLPPGTHYEFTDVSPGFLDAARARFGARVATRVFDLEQPPARQGIADGGYDLVLAANVVHATRELRASLGHLRALLAPGGSLLLVESTAAQAWWDIVFGLTGGWWRFADTDLRPDHALLAPPAWRALLADAGFDAPQALPVDAEARLSLLVARAPGPALRLVHRGAGHASRDLALALQSTLRAAGVPAEAVAAAEPVQPAGRVCYLGAIDLQAEPGAADAVLREAFELTRAQARSGGGLDVVTQGAAGPQDSIRCPEAAPLWGLGLVAALEHPELGCRRLDLPADAPWPVAALARLLRDSAGETACAWRDGRWLAARVDDAGLAAPSQPTVPAGPRTALVTGGLGGIGPVLAGWLLEQGAEAVVLVGRRPATDAVQAQLQALGHRVHAWVADAADAAAMRAVIERIGRELPPLREVWQLTGALADGALLATRWERFASILPAKIAAARVLDRLTRGLPLERFVLFSSSASLFGNPGQANHAAANAYLDALAAARRAEGLPGLSLQWGTWAEVGAVVSGAHLQRLTQAGARPITPALAREALDRALGGPQAVVGVVPVDWTAFLAPHGETVPPFFARMAARRQVRTATRARAADAPKVPDLRATLAATPAAERPARLLQFLQAQAAAVLQVADPATLDTEQALSESGLDSLLALELRARIGDALGEKQPATLLFNYPSIAALAGYLAQALEAVPAPADQPEAVAAGVDVAAAPPSDEAIRAEVTALSQAELEALIEAEFARATAA